MESDWASLPNHLVYSIMKKIETADDIIEFDAVCASWHSEVMDTIPINLTRQIPMLLIPSKDSDSHTICNVFTNTLLDSNFVVPYAKRFVGSAYGWLFAVQKDFSVTLYKPYSEKSIKSNNTTTICLPILHPDLFYVKNFDYHVEKATMSADPLRNPDQCIVAAIFGNYFKLAFVRPGKDTTWAIANGDINKYFHEIFYYNGQFYALKGDGEMYSMEITDEPFNINIKLAGKAIPQPICGNSYLVESQGKLLQVLRLLDWRFPDDDDVIGPDGAPLLVGRDTTDVYVYELDFDTHTWINVESLGDVSLFMGDNTSISLFASDFPGYCLPNSVYFTHDTDALYSDQEVHDDFGIYNYGSLTMEKGFDLLDATTLSKIYERVPIWVDIRDISNVNLILDSF